MVNILNAYWHERLAHIVLILLAYLYLTYRITIAMAEGDNHINIGRENAENALIDENRRLNEAQALGHIGDFYFDAISNSVTWSDELYRIMGVPIGEPMNFEKAISCYVEEDRSKLVALATACMASNQPFEMEAKFQPFGHTETKTLFLRAKPVENGITGIVQDITSQKNAELEVLRLRDKMAQKAEDKFKILFNSMDEGYCIIQMIYDEDGKPCDWIYLEVNPAFERHNGLHNATGKTIREFAPDIEQKWMDMYNAVAETGESIRFEEDSDALHRIFDLYAFRIGTPEERKVAVLFTDITARKNSEKQQLFLLKLNEALRSIANPVQIEEEVTRTTMAYFDADRCYYCEVSGDHAIIRRDAYTGDLPSVAGTYPIGSFAIFKKIIDEGQPLVVYDAAVSDTLDESLRQLCLQLQVISFVDVPIVKNGRVVGILCLVQSRPRKWTQADVELVTITAERIWAAVEKAKAEETLRRRESELVRVQEIGNIGGVHIDVLNGLIGERSPEYLRIHGLPADLKHETHQDWLNRLHPADRKRAEQTLFDALNSWQTSYENEYRIIRPSDGQERWIYAKMDIERTAEGKPARLTGVHIDITNRKLTEEALRESEERLRVTLESAVDYAFMTFDIDGYFTGWSKGAQMMFGYEDAEVIGKWTELIFTPEDKAAGMPAHELAQAALEGRAMDERWHLRKDGSRFYVSGVMAPMLHNAQIIGFVKVARDMTRQRLLEQQKDTFIGVASHELKTPVTSIKTYGQIVEQSLRANGDEHNAILVEKLNNQIRRLNNLISELLDTTLIEEGKLVYRKEPFVLNDLIMRHVEEMQHVAGGRRLLVQLNEPSLVEADKERINQVLTNLLSNAIKYSPDNTDIVINSIASDNEIEVSIADKGIGIPKDAIGKLFERFYRVSGKTMNTYPGMGLGLYISAEIVKSHGGKIIVESKEGEGSVFKFTLPREK